MADVTGRIGTEEVELNNAATEATLRLLLQATLATDKKQKENIAALAQKAGLDPAAVKETNQALVATTPSMNALGRAAYGIGAAFGAMQPALTEVINITKTIAGGDAQASDVFRSLSKIPGPAGLVAAGLTQIALIQEAYLKSYQQMSAAGVNFGGSLTEMRLAASQTYMTLDQFTNVIKANGPALAKMGGTANEGAKAFVAASNTLLSSDAGRNLRALGYTTEEVNQGMLEYISITGGRSKKEMQDRDALAKSTTIYLQELDQLAAITGKSREEQAKKVKEEMEEAEFQLFLASKSKEERELIEGNVKRATALYGKGGADIAKASAMGVAVQGEAGKKLTALSGRTAESIQQDLELRRKYGAQSQQVQENEIRGRKANAEDLGRLAGPVGSFSGVLKGNEDAVRQAARDRVAGEQEIGEQYKTAAAERSAREQSQAAEAAKTQDSLKQLGQAIMELVTPVLNALLPAVNAVVQAMVKYKEVTYTLVAAVIAAYGAYKVSSLLGGGGGGGGDTKLDTDKIKPGGGGGGGLAAAGRGMRAMAGGLRAFANPQVLLGSVAFGLAIAAVGAGIAGAAWLTGKALPTLAEGLGKLAEIDGGKLSTTGGAMFKVGASLLTFAPFAVYGIPAAFAVNQMADGLVKMQSVDPAKLERVAAAMDKVRQSTPTVGETLRAGLSGLVSKVTGTAAAAEPGKTGAASATSESGDMINLVTEVKRLNSVTSESLKYLKEVAEYTRRNVDATKGLNGNLF